MRRAFAVLGVLAAVLAGCGDDPKPPAEETVVPFEVADGKRAKGPAGVEVKVGDRVVIQVTTDAPDELHVHGYEKTLKIEPGKPATLRFTAHLPGVWEIELHEGGGVLTELKVAG